VRQQKIKEVLSIAGKWGHTLSQAAQNGECQVQKRKAGKHEGQQDLGGGTIGGSKKVQSQERRNETQRSTSTISHENAGGRKIKEKKTQATSKQNPG
jgi:hypothetical protein